MDKLLNLIIEVLEVNPEELSLETTREELEEWDSLGHIQLISEIENQFGVVIPFEEINEIKMVKDFLKYLS